MDERWELSRGPRSISLHARRDGMIGVQLEDPSEIAFVKFSPSEAIRIALELLRRAGVDEHATVRELRAHHTGPESTG